MSLNAAAVMTKPLRLEGLLTLVDQLAGGGNGSAVLGVSASLDSYAEPAVVLPGPE